MKKLLSALTAAAMTLAALPLNISAEEYEPYPDRSLFESSEAFYKAVSDGIKEGKYFADFNCDGNFDPIDVQIILAYYGELMIHGKENFDWDSKEISFYLYESQWGPYLDKYDDLDYLSTFEPIEFTVKVSSETRYLVEKYGNICETEKDVVDSGDASEFLRIYRAGFDKGDVNNDEKVDASDASDVLSYYSKSLTGQDVREYEQTLMDLYGDVNGDSTIDASDASAILSIYAKNATS